MSRVHHITRRFHPIVGLFDTPDSRATCSCGWQTGWDNGWGIITRWRIRRHRRKVRPDESVLNKLPDS